MLTLAELAGSTPWIVRTFLAVTIATVVLVVALKVAGEVGKAKSRFDAAASARPSPAETEPSLPVSDVYRYVDALIRASKEAATNSQRAMQLGQQEEASAFAFAAMAYLQSAQMLAPKRVASVVPDAQQMIDAINKMPSQHLRARLDHLIS